MDQRSLPSAAELGISEGEYERILRDMHRQGRPVPLPVRHAPDPESHRGGSRVVLLSIALVVAVAFLLTSGSGRGEPTYAFMKTHNGEPVTYSSCRVIQVAVYPAGGPPGAEQLVRDAVARLRSATGLDIVVTGAFGGHAPNWNFEASPTRVGDPISVSWQDGEAIAELTDHTVGLGGSRTAIGRGGTPHFVAGTIALSRDYYEVLDERGDRSQALGVLLHEFAHVFGLAHVDSASELMHEGDSDVDTFGEGDLQGLRRLGQGPCV